MTIIDLITKPSTARILATVGIGATCFFSINNLLSSLDSTRETVIRIRVEDSHYPVSNTTVFQLKDKPPVSSTQIISDNGTTSTTHKTTQLSDYFSSNEYRLSRKATYSSWFDEGGEQLLRNADKNGPILDFYIAGFAKCGTTTMEANLGYVTPMPVGDICTAASNTVFYAYHNWPKEHGKDKPLRGSKCPQVIDGIEEMSKYLPRTTIIIGIRHPVLWFQSFWNQQASNQQLRRYDKNVNSPYYLTKPCGRNTGRCRSGCPHGQLFCIYRGRFHVALARLGKTALNDDERKLLAPNDADGGNNLKNRKIKNPIFVYEQSELSEDYIWDTLAEYFNVTAIPHDIYRSSHGLLKSNSTDFCEEEYDNFRAIMMPYAYDLSVWLQDYFIPVAKNESSSVTIPNTNKFHDLVEKYKKDPCDRLFRMNNGTYVRYKPNTTVDIIQE